MIKEVILDRNQQPTEEQIRQIEEAAAKPIVFDEDSPELTSAMEKAFRLAAKNRNTQRKTMISQLGDDTQSAILFVYKVSEVGENSVKGT